MSLNYRTQDMDMFINISTFFFQAKDGIRDGTVTGVQTCALPIYQRRHCGSAGRTSSSRLSRPSAGSPRPTSASRAEIGRASCRERVLVWVVAGLVQKIHRVVDCPSCTVLHHLLAL